MNSLARRELTSTVSGTSGTVMKREFSSNILQINMLKTVLKMAYQ
jgi:hypothetical protein